MIYDLYHYFIVLVCPSLIGALFFNVIAHRTTKIKLPETLILMLFTYTTMIIGLYFFHNVRTTPDFMVELQCLSFSRRHIFVSSLVSTGYGIIFGFIRRFFFWIRSGTLLASEAQEK